MSGVSGGPAVRVEGVTKLYRRVAPGQRFRTLKSALLEGSLVGRAAEGEAIVALRDVSFEVARGEAFGIVGSNGSGKSTLLKLLAGILRPTRGRVVTDGRVAALIELGAGFHPEISGRENVFINGALLGLSRREIERRYERIVDFSGLADFMEEPVKNYSSGMYVRLGFAVAIHTDPEILLVDEVLAVGDESFAHRCLRRIEELLAAGRTVLFVSHNMQAVRSLCTRAVLLRDGRVAQAGDVDSVVDEYLGKEARAITDVSWNDPGGAPGNDIVRVARAALVPDGESPGLDVSRGFRLLFDLWFLRPQPAFNIVVNLYALGGDLVFASPSERYAGVTGLHSLECRIPGRFLNDGHFFVNLQITGDSRAIFVLEEALQFEIADIEREGSWFGKWPGVIRPYFDWKHQAACDEPRSRPT